MTDYKVECRGEKQRVQFPLVDIPMIVRIEYEIGILLFSLPKELILLVTTWLPTCRTCGKLREVGTCLSVTLMAEDGPAQFYCFAQDCLPYGLDDKDIFDSSDDSTDVGEISDEDNFNVTLKMFYG